MELTLRPNSIHWPMSWLDGDRPRPVEQLIGMANIRQLAEGITAYISYAPILQAPGNPMARCNIPSEHFIPSSEGSKREGCGFS